MAKIRRIVFAAALALALTSSALAAELFDAATKSAIREIITRQLDALAHDDGKSAESFATPAIRDKFPEPDKFLDMVKKGYAPLVHPRSTQFGETIDSPHGPLQKMVVVAADGTVWTAIYSLEKVEGSWRISGCGLSKDEGQQAI